MEDELGLVLWLGGRWADCTDDVVPCGEIGRLGPGDAAGAALSTKFPFPVRRDVGPSIAFRVLELRIRYTYGYTMVADGSSKDAESNS